MAYTLEQKIIALKRPKFLELVRQHRPWLTPKEAAVYLHVSVRTLEVWRAKKMGPAFHKSKTGLIRYHLDALDTWMTAQIAQVAVSREVSRTCDTCPAEITKPDAI